MTIYLQASGAELDSWLALKEIIELVPDGWCITGGSLVRLHLADSSRPPVPQRATEDIDVILNVKASRANIKRFENALAKCGFVSDGVNASGANHRWVREADQAQIDVLAPAGITETVQSWSFDRLGKLIPTRGAHFSLEEVEKLEVDVRGHRFWVPAPSILGALYGKCSALLHSSDSKKERHYRDIANLVFALSAEEREFLATPSEPDFKGTRRKGNPLTGRQKHRLVKGLSATAQSPDVPEELRKGVRNLVELIELEAPGSYR